MASENSGREKSAAQAIGHLKDVGVANGRVAPLLVSVRSLAEAHAVVSSSFEVLDFKEPDNGPLGACHPRTWWQLSDAVEKGEFANKRFSVALGESSSAFQLASSVPPTIEFAKCGPAGIESVLEINRIWDRLRDSLPTQTKLVAVAYADARLANTIEVEQVLEAAITAGLKTFLIDTYSKGSGGTLTCLSTARMERIIKTAQDADCETVIAGRIAFADAPRIIFMGARRIGVRGALCRGTRNGEIDSEEVARWTKLLTTSNRAHSELN